MKGRMLTDKALIETIETYDGTKIGNNYTCYDTFTAKYCKEGEIINHEFDPQFHVDIRYF